MNVLKSLIDELASMFAGDLLLSAGIVATILAAAALRFLTPAPPLAAGALLFLGCALVLALRVFAAARK
jgi:hypothetical protein